MSIARGLLMGSAIALATLALADQFSGIVTHALLERDARACALESYGTDTAIARCYKDRGLPVPQNFNARTEEY